jgi:prepilin-type processing-associated H-X9-DG protein
MALIATLAGLVLPAVSKGVERARRAACLNNLKQLGMGTIMYAEDHNGDLVANTRGVTTRSNSDDDVSHLFPDYVGNTRTFCCPNTRNKVRANRRGTDTNTGEAFLRDLTNSAAPRDREYGHSYEVYGAIHNRKKTQSLLDIYVIRFYPPAVRTQPGPSRFWLFVDSANAGTNTEPDEFDNHGRTGSNAAYCDGHAAWVPRKHWRRNFNISLDANWAELTP